MDPDEFYAAPNPDVEAQGPQWIPVPPKETHRLSTDSGQAPPNNIPVGPYSTQENTGTPQKIRIQFKGSQSTIQVIPGQIQ